MNERAERRAMIALLTVFALLVQMLIPSLAMAAPRGPGDDMMICTSMGLQSAPTNDDTTPKSPSSHLGSCNHCVCATPSVTAPEPAPVYVPVRYTAYVLRLAQAHDRPAASRVLAAPPPPSRGPPTQLT